ncbi:hypothetical protein H8356DRAFT_1070732 [Neocallimastix lanati (nom. inval.)]|nr:hypothetical protein H8356DRAFT_1070732 [Neocallimastix sp. JGI-2020a]
MSGINNKDSGSSPISPNNSATEIVMKKPKNENLSLTNEKHIYTYDNDKNKRSVPETPKRKEFKIVCIVLGVIGLYLFGFSLFLTIYGGFTDANFNDLNANCRYAMIILSVFVVFISATGYAGAYTNWKPIILTFSVLVSMGLLGHLYVAKKCLDAIRFTERDLAISWWDVYTDYVRADIQDKYSCCGYKDYKDLPVASKFCLGNEVDVVLQYPEDIKDAANVLKNDSYRKKYGDADSSGGVPGAGNPGVAIMGKRDVNVYRFEETLKRRAIMEAAEANQVKQDLKIYKAQGCRDVIVPKIKSKLKLVCILNYALTVVYIIAGVLSIIYWENMRKEKEFDEFA